MSDSEENVNYIYCDYLKNLNVRKKAYFCIEKAATEGGKLAAFGFFET